MKKIAYSFGIISTGFLLFIYLNSNYQAHSGRVFEADDSVPEIELADPNGKKIKLSKLRGKVVLIDFWASWCGPCRRENPNLLEDYLKYNKRKFMNGKGFEIYSVSIDRNKNELRKAIDKDQLVWKSHVIDEQKKASDLYGVSSIPYAILIDEKGQVIAQGNELRGMNLHLTLDRFVQN
jgi:thiol-disulfide isomerase/thioredoxin